MIPKRVVSWLRIVSISLVMSFLTPATALAEGLRLQTDLTYRTSLVDTTDTETGEMTQGEFSRFSQRYDLDLQKELYPYLTLHAGGLFDMDTSRTSRWGSLIDADHTKIEERAVQYFAGLRLTNPVHKAGFTYRNSEVKASLTDLGTQTILRDQFIVHWNWRPVDLPIFNVDYNRTHALNKPRTRDSTNELLAFRSRYEYEDVSVDYTYTRNDNNDTRYDNNERLADTGSLTQLHNGAIRYSTRLFRDRVSLTAGTRLNYSTLEPSGQGEIRRPTSSLGSEFYMLDDSDNPRPLENPSGDFTSVDATHPLTAVNIGSGWPLGTGPESGSESRWTQPSFGLNFGSVTEVDTLYVLPLESDDPDLDLASPLEIDRVNGYFSWEVFISDDQEHWEEHRSGFKAEYSIFDNRFELSFFPPVSTRYIKVRVTAESDPRQISGQIPISRVQGFTTIDGSTGETLKDLDQNYNFGLRWDITDRTTTSYDAYYKVLTSEPSGRRRSTLTNSFSARHLFNPIFVGNARVLRSDVHSTGRGDGVHHSYVASIRGDYLETFNQTLTYSGAHTRDEDETSTVDSIFLRNSADLYRDWSANLDLGQSWTNPSKGGKSRSTLIRVRTSLIPNTKLHLRLDYSFAWVTEEGEDSRIEQRGRAEVFLVPLKTLSLFAAVSFRNRDMGNRATDITQDYSVNWAPFPDGTLNFTLGYNYFSGPRGVEERFVKPGVRWEVARGVLLTVQYTTGVIESATEKSDLQTFNANLRVYY
jgi:hypothetical protein